ncbi:MAG: hypothetical protein WCV63_00090 [Negativicutes bacterium]|jgi:hypothetical protein
MKKILIIAALLFAISSITQANPIIKSTIQEGVWTNTILVFSSSKLDVYIPEDMINMNLFFTKYPENGNFAFVVYIDIKDKDMREKLVNDVKAGIDSRIIGTIGKTYPDLLKYVADVASFDMQKKQVTISREYYIDKDGELIGIRDMREINPLDKDHSLFSKISENCEDILIEAKNNPKNADIIAQLQQNRK